MPYIDSTPKGYPLKFEEDNLQDIFSQMLTNNGWVMVRTFYKAAVDTRAYNKLTDRVNYAIARHMIFKNSDGALLGFAVVGQFARTYREESVNPIRRPNDDKNPDDKNFGMSPTWEEWVLQRYADTASKTNLYFYMLEKLPNETLAPNGGLVSIVTMPGMSGTAYDVARDRDRKKWGKWYYSGQETEEYDTTAGDMEFDGKILSASPYHVIRSVLDIEVLGSRWEPTYKEAVISDTDPRIMQSPIVKTTLRAEFLEYIDDPVWHTNWWTDSEVRMRGHVDSHTIFLIMQADNAPDWEKNLVPTIPLYFGRILSLDGDKDEGYALFSGTIPPAKRVNTNDSTTIYYSSMTPQSTVSSVRVADVSKLPAPPAFLSVGGTEIVKLIEVEGSVITVERGQLGTIAKGWGHGTAVSRLSTNNENIDNRTVVSMFDFDDPGATVGEVIQPLLKLYPSHPSNGVDNVMVSRSRFGARYQAHYLSWNAPPNAMPPSRSTSDGRKYPRAYEPAENTTNYKWQFNPSRYSDKIHSSRVFVVHPEEGVRGYLDKAIGFDSQSINASNLRVRKEDCPEKVYEMYKYLSIGAVSPLTKVPASPYRPVGLGIYSEDFNPNKEPWDTTNDATPPKEVTITSCVSPQTQTIDITFVPPDDEDLRHVNIYINDVLYAKGITRTDFYRITGLTTGFTPEIKITTVDLAGNESVGVIAPTITVS